MKHIQTFESFLNESKFFTNRHDMESIFKNKGVKIDVQDFNKDSGFFTTYDNITRNELRTIIDKLGYSYEFKISEPIKSQESVTYLLVNLDK